MMSKGEKSDNPRKLMVIHGTKREGRSGPRAIGKEMNL